MDGAACCIRQCAGELTVVVDLSRQRLLDEFERDSLIKRFEFTYEMGWKLMMSFEKENGVTGMLGSKDVVRHAVALGLIENGEAWMDMIDARNQTSHVYDEDTAADVADSIIFCISSSATGTARENEAYRMFGLSDRSYKELIQIVASIPEIEEAIIYGSRARGDYWHASDIDLSLRGKDLTKKTQRTLNDKLYESHIPYFFDTNIYSEIRNPAFKANVDRDGKMFFRRGAL